MSLLLQLRLRIRWASPEKSSTGYGATSCPERRMSLSKKYFPLSQGLLAYQIQTS